MQIFSRRKNKTGGRVRIMKRIVIPILLTSVLLGVFSPILTPKKTSAQMIYPSVQLLSSIAVSQAEEEAAKAKNTSDKYSIEQAIEDQCGFLFSGTLIGCLEYLFYFFPYLIGAKFMYLSASFFDTLAAITLQSTYYSGAEFIAEGWRITRDFANIFLILILLFTALSFVLDIEIAHANPKKMLASIVLIALIINFSMFITEVVIDISNTLALVFYNQIGASSVVVVDGEKNAGSVGGVYGNGATPPKSISTQLVQAFEPQKFQSKKFWQGLSPNGIIGDIPPSTVMGLLILVGIVYFVMAWSLFIAAMACLGRMVSLWIAIVFAPIAFVSYIIPKTKHIHGVGWDHWWADLLAVAFGAPIYFFFLLLISIMAKSQMVRDSFAATHSSYATLFIMLIFFAMLVVMILKATKYVKSSAGEFGQVVANLAQKGIGLAGGLALGGVSGVASLAGRRILGGRAMKFAKNEANLDMASGRTTNATKEMFAKKFNLSATDMAGMSDAEIKKDSRFQTMQKDMLRKVESAQKRAARSYDFRQTGMGATARQFTGMNMGSFGALSMQRAAGGFEGEMNAKAAKLDAIKKKLAYNHEQQNGYEDTQDERDMARKDLEIKLQPIRDEWKKLNNKEGKLDPRWAGLDAEKKELEAAFLRATKGVSNIALGNKDGKNKELAEGKQILVLGRDGQAIKDKDGKDVYHTIDSDDVRLGRTQASYFKEHVEHKVKKADGELVTEHDVSRADLVGSHGKTNEQISGMLARNKGDRAKSLSHMELAKQNYALHGDLLDSSGSIIRTGHLDLNERKEKTKDIMGSLKLNIAELKNSKGIIDAIENFGNIFKYGVTDIVRQSSA
ncbi:MAG: hypothetical protein KA052_03720, partial [Candidatus Pacebacteria bacterium]|nr:hypothetical protein [Candidatus Paceibacterota bacterium]